MTGGAPARGRLWGRQYPFERNHLQRTLVLLALATVFAVSVILLVHADLSAVIAISFICAGLTCAVAAASRARYVRETRLGFAVLATRDARFVLGSAAAFAVTAVLVVVLVLV
jgi:hypothetical protein